MINDTISIDLGLYVSNAEETYDSQGKLKSYVEPEIPFSSLSALCVLNGETIQGAFSLPDFIRSRRTGEWEIFTCSCGHAGCAGIFDGIKVKVRKHTIEWRVPHEHNEGYWRLNKRFYSFDRKEYDSAIDSLMSKLVEYSKSDTIYDQFTHWHDDSDQLSNCMKYYNHAYNGTYWWKTYGN